MACRLVGAKPLSEPETIIDFYSSLSLNQCWNSLTGPLETNLNEILIEIHAFSFTKIHLKMSSGKWRPFCAGLNVLRFLNKLTTNVRYGPCAIWVFWCSSGHLQIAKLNNQQGSLLLLLLVTLSKAWKNHYIIFYLGRMWLLIYVLTSAVV